MGNRMSVNKLDESWGHHEGWYKGLVLGTELKFLVEREWIAFTLLTHFLWCIKQDGSFESKSVKVYNEFMGAMTVWKGKEFFYIKYWKNSILDLPVLALRKEYGLGRNDKGEGAEQGKWKMWLCCRSKKMSDTSTVLSLAVSTFNDFWPWEKGI